MNAICSGRCSGPLHAVRVGALVRQCPRGPSAYPFAVHICQRAEGVSQEVISPRLVCTRAASSAGGFPGPEGLENKTLSFLPDSLPAHPAPGCIFLCMLGAASA